jgi:hypothetical protein
MSQIQGMRPVTETELTGVHGGLQLCKLFRDVVNFFKHLFC